MSQNLATMTPVEIDTILSEMWGEQAKVQAKISNYRRAEAETYMTIQKIKAGARLVGYRTALQGIELMEQLNLLNENIVAYQDELKMLELKSLPYENEYVRRGRWNRVYLAQSHDGHAHNGTECSTCHHGEHRTQFAWLVQYSGKTEAEIIADAGERACTTCYKDVPTNILKRPTKMFTPDEIEAQKAREEREAERVRKAQAAADKSIFTPEGETLYEGKRNDSYGKVKTLRAAEIAATDALYELIREQQHAVDPEWAWFYEGGRRTTEKEQMEISRHAWCLIRSIAHKKGLSFQEVFETHEKKAQAKVKKIDREWAKDPRNPNRSK